MASYLRGQTGCAILSAGMNRQLLSPYLARGLVRGLLGGMWLLRRLCAPPFVAHLLLYALLHAQIVRLDSDWLHRFRHRSAPAARSSSHAPYRLYPFTCCLLE